MQIRDYISAFSENILTINITTKCLSSCLSFIHGYFGTDKPVNERVLDVLRLLHEYGQPQLWHEVSHCILSDGELDISRVITAANLSDLEFLVMSGEARDVASLK